MSVNVSNALAIPGWTSEVELLWLAEQASTRSCIVEIGSWKGRSTRAMADSTKGIVWSVDTWDGTPEDGHLKELIGQPGGWLAGEFMCNAGLLANVEPWRCASLRAASLWCGPSPDMIFIDAAHDYDNVKADILAWRPLLAEGGLICGHDFDAGRPGVVKAVRECFKNPGRGPGSIWIGRD